MSRALIILRTDADRELAARWAHQLPINSRVEFKKPKRTVDQNSRLWLMLTEFSRQLSWYNMRLSPDDWKLIFLDGLKREIRAAPNIDGNGFVNLGRSSSDLSKAEMADLFEIMEAFAAKHGVTFPWHEEAA